MTAARLSLVSSISISEKTQEQSQKGAFFALSFCLLCLRRFALAQETLWRKPGPVKALV